MGQEMIHRVALGISVALALFVSTGYALQEFTLEDARVRIERLESRVATLEAEIPGTPSQVPASNHTINGSVVIELSANFEANFGRNHGKPCDGKGGYSDIHSGASVAALDEYGTIIGSTHLSDGQVIEIPGKALGCSFIWAMDVPDSDFYVFLIANRNGPTYSRADLEATGWIIDLAIGD